MAGKSLVLLLVAMPILSGCGGQNLASVSGTVTLDGNPLPQGSIVFETTGQRPATGKIENGKIVEVTCYKPGDGAPIGTHKVAVTSRAEAASAIVPEPGAAKSPGRDYMAGKSLIPIAYGDPETSGLTAEIAAGGNVIEIKLKSSGP